MADETINTSTAPTPDYPGPVSRPMTAPPAAGAAPVPNPEPALSTPASGQSFPLSVTPPQALGRRPRPGFGDIAKSVLGAINGPQTRPQIDEKGNMTEVPIPQDRPGQIFRHILAGAILGGAAAQEEKNKNPKMGFGGGFAEGGKAVIQQKEKQVAQQKTQAKEDWERDQEKQKNQISNAMMNSQTHHFLLMSAGLSLEQHDKLMEGDQVLIDALTKAKVMADPSIPEMTESQLAKYLTNPENAKKYATHRALIVGREPAKDADGNLSYEFKLAFYKDNANIKVTPEMRAYFKSHGVLVDKNSDKVLQVDKVLTPEEAAVLFKQARAWDIDNMQDPKSQAEIAAKQAETAFYNVKAAAERQDITLKGEERKKALEGQNALDALDKAYAKLHKDDPNATMGDALDTLTPSQKIVLLPKISEDIATNRALLNGLPKDETMWTPEQHEVWAAATKRLQDAAVFSNITQRSIAQTPAVPTPAAGSPESGFQLGPVNENSLLDVKVGSPYSVPELPIPKIGNFNLKKYKEVVDKLNSLGTINERTKYIDSLGLSKTDRDKLLVASASASVRPPELRGTIRLPDGSVQSVPISKLPDALAKYPGSIQIPNPQQPGTAR